MKTKAAPKRRTTVAKRPTRTRAASNGSAKAKASARRAAAAPAAPKAGADMPIIYVNGQYLPKSKAMVSVYDHGLLYGDGVFEGIRIYQGKIFKCQSHIERLYRCAESIKINIPVSKKEMEQIQRRCVEVNNIKDGYIRLVITRGYGTLGLDPRRCPVPGVICIADQIRLYAPEFYESGMRVIVAKRPKTPVACLDPRIKTLNYLNNILAKVEAIEAGCDEAIMLSTDGLVTECTGDNIFIVKNGTLYTPPNVTGNSGSLEGVTQSFVRDELIPMCGYKCVVKEMRLPEVMDADEVFLTGTAAEIIGVNQIEETTISDGEGPITNRLRSKFREIVSGKNVPEN